MKQEINFLDDPNMVSLVVHYRGKLYSKAVSIEELAVLADSSQLLAAMLNAIEDLACA